MARSGYTAITVTISGRDAMRDLAVAGTTAVRAKVSMSSAARAAVLHAERDPAGFAEAMTEVWDGTDDESEEGQ